MYGKLKSYIPPIFFLKILFRWRALNLRSHEQLPVLSGAAVCPVFASTTSFRPSPVAFSLSPPPLLDGMKDKAASLNTSNAKIRLNFGSIIEKN